MISSEKKQPEQGYGLVYPTLPLVYQPDLWNGERVVGEFNCYSYALNTQEFGCLPLGGALVRNKRALKFPLNQEFLLRAGDPSLPSELWLKMDGLQQIRAHEYGPHEKHIIAFDAYQMHFYRLDANGVWSHKTGKAPVTNQDENGHAILDLENAHFIDRSARRYGGTRAQIRYYVVPDEGVRILNESVRTAVEPMVNRDRPRPERRIISEEIWMDFGRRREKSIRKAEMQLLPYALNA